MLFQEFRLNDTHYRILKLDSYNLERKTITNIYGKNKHTNREAQKFVNPIPFLEDLKGKQVVIKLKWGQEYRGNLQAFDGYFNFQLDNAEEWIDDECKGNLGEILPPLQYIRFGRRIEIRN